MALAILVLITALCISAVAIYYSVAGLVAIFAAAALPIMIMGGVLEVGKLVTAVWLHKYWKQATWWLKSYLSIAVFILMLITSMGIFGFLSKAHIEQTSASEESVARIEQIETEIVRQIAVVGRAENKIRELESSGSTADSNIQQQIDKEQVRIDKAFDRIQPAIAQQNKIIEDARATDNTRTKPYEDQLTSITAEIVRLENSAREYETSITNLKADTSAIDPIVAQIATINATITKVQGQIASNEREQIKQAQTTIGANADGSAGPNTRRAANAWIETQKLIVNDLNAQVATVRNDATTTVDTERTRLADVVKDIREVQIPALKARELTMLGKIDEVRQTESPVIATARDEIQRLRESAEQQVAQSQGLINRLRSQLAMTDKVEEIDTAIDDQSQRIKTANSEIDLLTEEKYTLQAEYRKLEAEVGPVKYIAEFVYGEQADANLLEEAVRWVIIIIIFVFDPLAVLLLIASQYTFEFRRKELEDDDGERLRLERQEHERARAQRIVDNPGFTLDDPVPPTDEDSVELTSKEQKEEVNDIGIETGGEVEEPTREPSVRNAQHGGTTSSRMAMAGEDDTGQVETQEADEVEDTEEESKRRKVYDELMEVDSIKDAKQSWKQLHPKEDLKTYKNLYIKGKIDTLPWLRDSEGYVQNQEQGDTSLWKDIDNK
jgi:hypothetical protein